MKNIASAYIERWNFLLGAIFVAIIMLMPEGLVPGTVRLWRWAFPPDLVSRVGRRWVGGSHPTPPHGGEGEVRR